MSITICLTQKFMSTSKSQFPDFKLQDIDSQSPPQTQRIKSTEKFMNLSLFNKRNRFTTYPITKNHNHALTLSQFLRWILYKGRISITLPWKAYFLRILKNFTSWVWQMKLSSVKDLWGFILTGPTISSSNRRSTSILQILVRILTWTSS